MSLSFGFGKLFLILVLKIHNVGVRSQDPPRCPGTCSQFPDCDAQCRFIGYGAGKCTGKLCCCSFDLQQFIIKPCLQLNSLSLYIYNYIYSYFI